MRDNDDYPEDLEMPWPIPCASEKEPLPSEVSRLVTTYGLGVVLNAFKLYVEEQREKDGDTDEATGLGAVAINLDAACVYAEEAGW